MKHLMIFVKSAALLLLVLFIAASHARAQNQTPANVALVGWIDPDTGLNWTKADNGTNVNWNQANAYCTNLRLGGYSDWRLPTIDELQGIYDPGIDVPGQWLNGNAVTFHVKGNLKLSGWAWSSTQKNAAQAWDFGFSEGRRISDRLGTSAGNSALCVRR
jgi:hypothetical protein